MDRYCTAKQQYRISFSLVAVLVFVSTLTGQVSAQEGLAVQTGKHFLWSVRTDDSAVYLLGSLHLLKSDAYPLDRAIQGAYDACDKIVFETDFDSMRELSVQARMMALGLYLDGRTLRQSVSEDTYELLKGKMAAAGLPLNQFERFKPWLSALTLTTLELKRLGFDPDYGIDRFFFNQARKDGKEVIFLESVEGQLNLFAAMAAEEQESFLRHTITDLEVAGSMVAELVNAWKTGAVDRLDSIIRISFREHPDIYDRLIRQRNRSWVSRIDELIREKSSTLVIVGAAHLVGDESVLELLKKRGHDITQH